MSGPNTEKVDRKPVRRFVGWAICNDGRISTICGAPLVYGTRKDAMLDFDRPGDYAVKVEIREAK